MQSVQERYRDDTGREKKKTGSDPLILLFRSEVIQIMRLHINTEIDKIAAVYRDVRQVFLKASNFKLIDKDVATFVISPA